MCLPAQVRDNNRPVNRTLLHTLLFLSVTSCQRQEIRVYIADRENDRDIAIPSPPAKITMPAKLPEGWLAIAPSGIRKASYRVDLPGNDPLECSVISFPGSAGGLEANVNRWRGEVGLQPLGTAELRASVVSSTIDNHDAFIVDIIGPSQSTLGAILPLLNETWFFKISGPCQPVSTQKQNFTSFLGNIRVAATQATAADKFTASNQEPRSLNRPVITYRVPEGWKEL